MRSALTTAFVLTACVSFAQAPGPRADLVRTTLPLEGAPKAIPGPYKVMSEPALGSPGHVAYWRESDRVPILGDVLINMNLITTLPGLHEPPAFFTPLPPIQQLRC